MNEEIDNGYKFRFVVKQSPQNGLWLISVEGIVVDTADTEDKAWDLVERRWSAFPTDSLQEVRDLLELQMHELRDNLRKRPEDDYYQHARIFQRIAELADAGLRISLLGRKWR